MTGAEPPTFSRVLGPIAKAWRWISEQLVRFRPPFDVEHFGGAYAIRDGVLWIVYEVHVVNRESHPNAIRSVEFRFKTRDRASNPIPDPTFRGEEIRPYGSTHFKRKVRGSRMLLDYRMGEIVPAEVLLRPARGDVVKGAGSFMGEGFIADLSSREEAESRGESV